jgi:hypothetical protein
MFPTLKFVALAALLALALPCDAAQWKSVRSNQDATLYVDTASIAKAGNERTLQYMVDYRKPQGDPTRGLPYRSIVVGAKVSCADRTIALRFTNSYAQNRAKGAIMTQTLASAAESRFAPLEPRSSDEDVWGYVCNDGKRAARK